VRIEQRVRMMMDQGLLEETEALHTRGLLTGTAAQAIGYYEALQVLQGDCTLEEAVTAVSTRTRRYAKRQRTWFRNQMNSRWIPVTETDSPEQIADQVARVWEETGPLWFEGGNS
jgi:tRNA dimethylallyltransferase